MHYRVLGLDCEFSYYFIYEIEMELLGGSIGIPYLAKTDGQLYFKDADLLWFKIRDAVDINYLYTFFYPSSILSKRFLKPL